mmetsp:Transcript_68096/g.188617  ORF Transcript_68096/g.188617 Transcript_68096/m.188617 type:complete len:343 (+) Transcript_68096:1121-2149(+)
MHDTRAHAADSHRGPAPHLVGRLPVLIDHMAGCHAINTNLLSEHHRLRPTAHPRAHGLRRGSLEGDRGPTLRFFGLGVLPDHLRRLLHRHAHLGRQLHLRRHRGRRRRRGRGRGWYLDFDLLARASLVRQLDLYILSGAQLEHESVTATRSRWHRDLDLLRARCMRRGRRRGWHRRGARRHRPRRDCGGRELLGRLLRVGALECRQTRRQRGLPLRRPTAAHLLNGTSRHHRRRPCAWTAHLLDRASRHHRRRPCAWATHLLDGASRHHRRARRPHRHLRLCRRRWGQILVLDHRQQLLLAETAHQPVNLDQLGRIVLAVHGIDLLPGGARARRRWRGCRGC